ncbi:MAG TPA: Rab family GTPase [Candidatus Lokiarchaeia archaeon]|nr:Rab family GTPase [Candidatus Lokiarchaeia archaeon]
MTPPQFTFKIIIGGAGGVGKTTLLHRYLHNVFLSDTALTVGVQFFSKEVVREGTRIMLSLWDLGGQDRFRFVQPSYCFGANAAMVFFDVTRLDTALQVNDWITMFRENGAPNIPIVLGGTKLDMADPESMDEVNENANELLQQLGLSYYITTSSKTGENVKEIFNYLADTLLMQANQGNMPEISSTD